MGQVGALDNHGIFNRIDGQLLFYQGPKGILHYAVGADIHPNVRLLWTRCGKLDVHTNEAFRSELGMIDPIVTCKDCLTASRRGVVAGKPTDRPRTFEAMAGDVKVDPETIPTPFLGDNSDPRSRVVEDQAHDPVHRPSHYTQGGIECIDALQAALTPEEFRGFLRGNALKYAWRLPFKANPAEDAEKAVWYLKRLAAAYDKPKGEDR